MRRPGYLRATTALPPPNAMLMDTPPPLRILVVDDDELLAMQIAMLVEQLGYAVLGPAYSAEQALALMQAEADTPPDAALLNIGLPGALDGIALAARLTAHRPLPLIFLTSYTDHATFERARAVGPFAFLIKPADQLAVQRALELALMQFAAHARPAHEGAAEAEADDDEGPLAPTSWSHELLVRDAFFIKDGTRLVKVPRRLVSFIQSEGNYTMLYTTDGRRFALRQPLRELARSLAPLFVQVHRRWLVNAECVEQVDPGRSVLRVDDRELPLGKRYRDELLARLTTLS